MWIWVKDAWEFCELFLFLQIFYNFEIIFK